MELWALQWTSAARDFADLKALDYDGPGPTASYSYIDFENRSNRVARNWLLRHGIGRNDVVVTITENRPEQVILLIACMKIGAIFAPLPDDFRDIEYVRFLDIYRPKAIILSSWRSPLANASGECIVLPEDPKQGSHEWHRLDSTGPSDSVAVTARPDDCGLVFTTSGSTAQPKCVMYSQRTLALLGVQKKLDHMRKGTPIPNGPGSTRLLNSGIRGITATYGLLTILPYGGRILMENVSKGPGGPRVWADLIKRHGVTKVVLFGSSMTKMIDQVHTERFLSVTSVVYSGTCFPPVLVQQMMDMFPNALFMQPYSLTEVAHITLLPTYLHFRSTARRYGPKSDEVLSIMSCAGIAFDGEVFLENPDAHGSGVCVGPNEIGQICVKSSIMMMGYYGANGYDAAKSAEVLMEDGFIRTGDLGRWSRHQDPKSGKPLLQVLGRCNDFIPHHAGINIAPREIEHVVQQLTVQVSEVAVVGVAHPTGAGEMLAAYVVTKQGQMITAADLTVHCRANGLSTARTPELWIISTSDNPLPTVSGKICKKTLRSVVRIQREISSQLRADVEYLDASYVSNKKLPRTTSWLQRARAIFQALDEDSDGFVDCSGLGVLLGATDGDAAYLVKRMLRAFGEDGGAVGAKISIGHWLELVSCISEERRTVLLLACQSVIASSYRNGVLHRLAWVAECEEGPAWLTSLDKHRCSTTSCNIS